MYLILSTFYAECDAFILPSVDDGFGMALFEAVANGVPSVATRNCGASELLVAERDCLLIDAFSVEQIKEAVLRLYEDRDLRDRLSVSGPAAVEALQEGGLPRPYEDGVDAFAGCDRRKQSPCVQRLRDDSSSPPPTKWTISRRSPVAIWALGQVVRVAIWPLCSTAIRSAFSSNALITID